MAPSPKKGAAYALDRVFSTGYPDDTPRDWSDGEDEELVHEREELPRVASRVVPSTDGSAEAVLSAPATPPPQSRARSSNVAASSGLSNSLPLSRTQSTPHTYSNNGGHGSPRTLAYAMRKVFSIEESSEWNRTEAEELVQSPSPGRVRSYVAAVGSGNGLGEEEGAELVLDADFDDVDVDESHADVDDGNIDESHADASIFADGGSKRGRFGIKSGYKLRRFLSTPSNKSLKRASSLRRTPSYEPEGTNEREEGQSSLYQNEPPQHDSSQLSSPIGLARTISFRRNRSKTKNELGKGGKFHDDDLSTVAESIGSSSSASTRGLFSLGGGKDGKRRSRRRLAIAVITFFVVAVALAGVGVYLIASRDEVDSSTSSQLEYTSLGDSGDSQVVVADESSDGASVDEGFDEVMDEAASDNEDGTWASRDDSGAPLESQSKPLEEPAQGLFGQGGAEPEPAASSSDNYAPYPSPASSSVEAIASLPAANATSSPTSKPTSNPTTQQPTDSPTKDTYTKFYVMADCPYDDNERNNLMPGYIEDLSTDAEFLVHLGDLQYAKVDKCREYAYRSASSILKKSPVPTFVLPGDNDINDCDDHEHGEEMWDEYFHKIDEEWEHSFELTRWGKLDESFSFLHKGVLYFGVNIVGGSPYSKTEKRKRHAEHLEYIHEILDGLNKDDFQVMVLFGHADPSDTDNHNDFFRGSDGFAAIAEAWGKPTVHFHGDWHEYYEVEGDFGVDNYMRISLDGESIAPPIKVEIDVAKENPVRVSRRRRDLGVECCRHGWPRRDEL